MRKSAIVNLNSSKFVLTIKSNCLVIIFSLIFVVGVILGTVFVKRNLSILNATNNVFLGFLEDRTTVGFLRIFLTALMDLLPIFLVVFLCGTSLVGVVLTPLAICYKGFSFGILAGYLYKTYMLKGIAFNALIFVPTNLIAALALIYCGKISFNFSLILLRSSMPRGQSVNLYNNFQSYCRSYTLSACFLFVSALTDALMSVGFIKLFNF